MRGVTSTNHRPVREQGFAIEVATSWIQNVQETIKILVPLSGTISLLDIS